MYGTCIHDAANFVTNERTNKAILGVGYLVQNTVEVEENVIKRVIGKEEGATNDIDGQKKTKKLLTLTS